jgi:hypothetical protein
MFVQRGAEIKAFLGDSPDGSVPAPFGTREKASSWKCREIVPREWASSLAREIYAK